VLTINCCFEVEPVTDGGRRNTYYGSMDAEISGAHELAKLECV